MADSCGILLTPLTLHCSGKSFRQLYLSHQHTVRGILPPALGNWFKLQAYLN